MNPNDPRHPWSRLAAAARQMPEAGDPTPPLGFATRVAALAFAQERRVASLFEHFALRAVGVACLLAVLSVAVNYGALTGTTAYASVTEEEALPTDDAVAVVLDLGD